MSDKYAPLSSACAGALVHRQYEKRKTAALEIEKMVKEFIALNNTNQVRRLIRVLRHEFVMSPNSHTRLGGLLAISTTAIGLSKDITPYAEDLIKPVLECFSDSDVIVRYGACEALFNVMKVCRTKALDHFIPIFNALSKSVTDPNSNVRNSSELLDRLLKDIVTETDTFDLNAFVPLLRERIYTKSPFARQFIISWISVLDMVPNLSLVPYLSDLLDGLFRILGDPNLEIKKMCETTLSEFLRSIKANPATVNFPDMINTLITHAANDRTDDLVQFIAIMWIKEFVQLAGPAMLPYTSGILAAILPCLAYETEIRRMVDIKETATAVNFTLTKLIALSAQNQGTRDDTKNDIAVEQLDLKSVVDVLIQFSSHNSIQTKVAVLKWIHDLYTKLPKKMMDYMDVIFPALQQTLSDDADQVAQQCLVVIAEVISAPSSRDYYNKFLIGLLETFKTDREFLEYRGHFIIRQLCVLLDGERVYRTLAEILEHEPDLKYASLMVDHLNLILLTAQELYETRNRLRQSFHAKWAELFVCLYRTWCHNPIATVALCLLTQNYRHVNNLIQLFGDLEVTVEFLTDLDQLVQLIESPIFSYLRLDLLNMDPDLIRSLYGLLMLLPQTDAFRTLKNRMSCIPNFLHCDIIHTGDADAKTGVKDHIDFATLLHHFTQIQNKHRDYRRALRHRELSLLQPVTVTATPSE